MKQPKAFFTFHCKRALMQKRLFVLLKLGLGFGLITLLFSIKVDFLISVLILFGLFFILKFIPSPQQESILVYYDRLIYKTSKKESELSFQQIAFIDQDIEEVKGHSYYKSVEFLDEAMSSLLYIDGQGYEYDELVFLCNRILNINKSNAASGDNEGVFKNMEEPTYISWE